MCSILLFHFGTFLVSSYLERSVGQDKAQNFRKCGWFNRATGAFYPSVHLVALEDVTAGSERLAQNQVTVVFSSEN